IAATMTSCLLRLYRAELRTRTGRIFRPVSSEKTNGRDAGAVEAQLQDVRGLLGARQLGVERLVAPGPEPGGPVDFDEEVRAPAPPAIHKRGLRDDLGAGPHGVGRLSRRRLEVPRLAERDLDDLAPLGPETLEVGALVQLALAPQQLGVLVGDEGTGAVAARYLEGQRCEVLALHVVVEIRRRKRDVGAYAVHGISRMYQPLNNILAWQEE